MDLFTLIETNNLTAIEQEDLTRHEATIKRGLNTFVEVGAALLAIRDERLYRAQFGTFEDYCRERWNISRSRAHRLIEAAEVAENLLPIGNIPNNEAQARPLTSLPPEAQREAWERAVETAPDGKVTAAHVQLAVDEIKKKMEEAENFYIGLDNEVHEIPTEEKRDFDYKRDARRTSPQDIYTPHGMDNCQTPAYALDPLFPYLLQFNNIWEPAAGEGLLVDAFYDCVLKNFQVIDTDLITENNFFEYEPENWDCLVTNPPYSIKYQWLKRCYQLGKPFALLMPIETLGAKAAQELFEANGVEIMLLNRRINFKMPNKGWEAAGAPFPTAWFTWGLGLGAQLIYGKIEYE